jgi:hypothetical protein
MQNLERRQILRKALIDGKKMFFEEIDWKKEITWIA